MEGAGGIVRTHTKVVILAFVLALIVLGPGHAWAQSQQPMPCTAEHDEDPNNFSNPMQCAPRLPLPPGTFHAFPLSDAPMYNGHIRRYPNPDTGSETVSLYGTHGNDEHSDQNAQAHYDAGVAEGGRVQPLCSNGNPLPPGQQTCLDGRPPAVVVLFLGFSNCDIEICGGATDIWPADPNGVLAGRPCSMGCPNPTNPLNGQTPYNDPHDGQTPHSLLYSIYHDSALHQDPHVFFFDGAYGGEGIDKWDPTSRGFYALRGQCRFTGVPDPECDYNRVMRDLGANGFSEKQVQAIFIKPAIGYPQCALDTRYCDTSYVPPDPSLSLVDAYQVEQYLGDILRYLKSGLNGTSRYPKLHQVFLTSRIYGGYSRNTDGTHGGGVAGCQSPEPMAYEEAFGVQRLIVAQIDQGPGEPPIDSYAGDVRYPDSTPWVDWGPYLWASGDNPRNGDNLLWCDKESQNQLCNNELDLRYGDLTNSFYENYYWGDHTHPSTQGAAKVADQILNFFMRTPGQRNAWTPWLDAH